MSIQCGGTSTPCGRLTACPSLPLGDAEGNGPFVIWELPINGDAPRPVPDDDPRSHPEFRYSPDGTQGGVRR